MPKKLLFFLLISSICLSFNYAFAYTINDPIGDKIGSRQFELYGINVIHSGNNLTFDIYTNYPKTGKDVGAWKTFAGDLALSLDGDDTYEYGVAFTGHDSLTSGGLYSVSDWYISNNYALPGFIYNKDKIVTIKNGTFLDSADFFGWEDISGDNPDYRWRVTLDADDFGLANFNGQNFKIFYSVATCSNDYISGSYTATPEPASLTLLGMGLLGIFGFRRRFNK